jgi:hypothetical protein
MMNLGTVKLLFNCCRLKMQTLFNIYWFITLNMIWSSNSSCFSSAVAENISSDNWFGNCVLTCKLSF